MKVVSHSQTLITRDEAGARVFNAPGTPVDLEDDNALDLIRRGLAIAATVVDAVSDVLELVNRDEEEVVTDSAEVETEEAGLDTEEAESETGSEESEGEGSEQLPTGELVKVQELPVDLSSGATAQTEPKAAAAKSPAKSRGKGGRMGRR